MKGETTMCTRFKLIAVAATLLVLLAACGPEAGRPRGGGFGADVGNHAPQGVIPASKVWNTRRP
jgi:hypothetical protein